ncbi:MAG: RNA methyltransferase [Lysobacterales bacterium]
METSQQIVPQSPAVAPGLAPELAQLRLVLVNTSHPGNLGAAARAAKTMGLRQLCFVAPKVFPHPDATAMASGADDLLAQAMLRDSLAAATDDCGVAYAISARRRGIRLAELTPREFAAHALSQARSAPVAVVFGNERVGLSNEEIERCQYLVRIPSDADYGSLNLAAAVQVISYELRLAAMQRPDVPKPPPPAPLADLERFFEHQARVLEQIGFYGSKSPTKINRRLRRLYQRALPDAQEISILRGILSQIEYALGPNDDEPGDGAGTSTSS